MKRVYVAYCDIRLQLIELGDIKITKKNTPVKFVELEASSTNSVNTSVMEVYDTLEDYAVEIVELCVVQRSILSIRVEKQGNRGMVGNVSRNAQLSPKSDTIE